MELAPSFQNCSSTRASAFDKRDRFMSPTPSGEPTTILGWWRCPPDRRVADLPGDARTVVALTFVTACAAAQHPPRGADPRGRVVRIGGIDPWITIRGDDRANP